MPARTHSKAPTRSTASGGGRALTVKEQLFVEAYIASGSNATEAARRAGYKNPNKLGPRKLVEVGIRDAIAARVQAAKDCMGADEVLERLTEQARGDIADFVDEHGRLDWRKAKATGRTRLVKSIAQTKYGPKLEVYDAHAALVDLGRHHKLFTDRVERAPEETAAEQAKADALAAIGGALERIALRKQAEP